MALTNYEESNLLKLILGNVAYTPPSIVYFGLSSTQINEDGGGASEPSSGNYSRVAVGNVSSSFTYASNQITNGTAVVFPVPSADWGQLNYIFYSDQSTGGSIRMAGSLSPSQTVGANQQLSFGVSDITITFD
jgi:hypothetical protein